MIAARARVRSGARARARSGVSSRARARVRARVRARARVRVSARATPKRHPATYVERPVAVTWGAHRVDGAALVGVEADEGGAHLRLVEI